MRAVKVVAKIFGVLLVLFLFVNVALSIAPYRTDVSYFDFINGQSHVYSSTLGIRYRERFYISQYGKLVKQLGLEGEPVWHATSHTEHGLGTLFACPIAGSPAADLQTFMSFVELGDLDNPTSEILAIQAVARQGNVRQLKDHTRQLISRLVDASPNEATIDYKL